MNNLKLTLGIEPTDKYEKAKMDLIQARKSFLELTQQEQQMLIEELVGRANVATVINLLNQSRMR